MEMMIVFYILAGFVVVVILYSIFGWIFKDKKITTGLEDRIKDKEKHGETSTELEGKKVRLEFLEKEFEKLKGQIDNIDKHVRDSKPAFEQTRDLLEWFKKQSQNPETESMKNENEKLKIFLQDLIIKVNNLENCDIGWRGKGQKELEDIKNSVKFNPELKTLINDQKKIEYDSEK
jgi:predicted RNase H-like nuclease (RuvC/YqgF family)